MHVWVTNSLVASGTQQKRWGAEGYIWRDKHKKEMLEGVDKNRDIHLHRARLRLLISSQHDVRGVVHSF